MPEAKVKDPWMLLGLTKQATVTEIKARWRQLASQHHPDRGGDPAVFHQYRTAADKALGVAEERERECPACLGKGKVQKRGIFLTCEACMGSGERS